MTQAKRFKKGWLLLGFVCAGAAIFHKPLLLLGCKAVLHQAIPSAEGRIVSYEKMQWENGAIAISGLLVKDPGCEFTADRVELKFSGDFFRLRFAPGVSVVHPQILLSSSEVQGAPALPFLYRTQFFQPSWTIKNGVLQLPSSSRFYFHMDPGEEKESIGSLQFSYDPDPLAAPVFTAEMALRGKQLQVGFKLQETELSRLLPLTALVLSDVNRVWEKASGEVELEGLVSFGRTFEIEELHVHGGGKGIVLAGPKMGIAIQCEEVQGAFSFPVADAQGFFRDKVSASLALKEGECYLSAPLFGHAFGIGNLNGQMAFEPQKEPQLTLSGLLVQEQRRIAFNLSGKGGVQEDSTFWSEVALAFTSAHGSEMQSLFSLCSHEGGDLALHVKIDNASFEHLDFFRAFCGAPGECVDGTAFAEATLLYKEGNWQSVSVENCLLDKMRWYFPQQGTTVFSEQVTGDCKIALGAKRAFEDLHLHLQGGDFLNPRLHLNSLSADAVMEKGVLQPSAFKGEWGALQADIAFLGPQAERLADLKISGDGQELLALLSHDKQAAPASLPLSLQVVVKMDGGVVALEGDGSIAGELIKGSASFSTASRTMLDLLSGNFPAFRLKEGKFLAERLTEKSYGAFIPLLFPGSALSGNLQCEALFSSARIQVKAAGDELNLIHPLAEFYLPLLKERPAQFFYDAPTEQWRGEVPLAEARLRYQDLGLSFENVEGNLKLEGGCLKAPAFYAECEGLALRGNIELELANAEGARLSLATSQIAGDVKGLLCVLSKFPSFPKVEIPAHGNFSSGDKGFILSVPMGPEGEGAEWSFKGSFDSLAFPVNAATSIRDARCDVAFDSMNKRLSVEKAEGTWELIDGTPFTVQIKRLSTQLSENCILDFALRVVDGKKEFAQIEGKATQTPPSGWEVAFDKQATHFGGTQLNITRCVLNEKMGISSFEMRPILKCQDLHSQAAFLQNAGFLPLTFSPKNLQEWQLEGTLQAQLSSEDLANGFSFQAESRDLKVKGESWTSFQVRGQKMGEKWLIEKLVAGGLLLKGAFIVDADGFTFPQFEGNWEGLSLKGSGLLKTEKKRFSCVLESVKGDLAALKALPKSTSPTAPKGTFIAGVALTGDFSDPKIPLQVAGEANLFIDLQSPLPVTASSRKALKFTYRKADGLVCKGIDFQLKHKFNGSYLAEFQVEKLVQQAGADLNLKGMQFSMTDELLGFAIDAKIVPPSLKELEWEGNLEGDGDLQFGKSGIVFQGNLKPGRYGFAGKSLQFEQFQLRYEKDLLSMRAKTQIEQQPLWTSFQADLAKEPFGMLKLFDNPKAEGLKILFSTQNSKVVLESVQGSCYGLTCALAKSAKRKVPLATVLTGEIKVDGNVLSQLLPKEIREGVQDLKFGSGYQWQGDLVLWQEAGKGFLANGALTGKEFEALGYRFRSLEAALEANAEHVVLSNLKIEDAAGAIGIQKIEINKQEGWELYIPQILVRQLQPSLMRKIDDEQSAVKPFTIKNFTMTDIRGRLGDKASLEGSGHLMFVNQFKKEASILDVPLDMIKKIGLDLGLLTPVQGEIQMELRGDKFYLVSLDNSFSEGDRAEFYLSPEKDLSYIDLEGKVHIDLKMRQDVVLKITEPFTLTIRGTLDKPRYGLQY